MDKMKKIDLILQMKLVLKIMIIPVCISLLLSCEIQPDYEYEYGNPGGKLNMTAWDFIQKTDSLSLMEEAIIAAGLQNLYSGSNEKTFIVPRNSAFRAYLKTNKFADVASIPVPSLQSVLKYHIVNAKVNFSDPALLTSNDPVPYPTESGEIMYLSHNTNYQGLINQGTKKSWTIITSNLEATNGIIHVTADVVYLSL